MSPLPLLSVGLCKFALPISCLRNALLLTHMLLPPLLSGCSPVGSVCGASSTAATSCSADEYQPLLGQSTGACTTCNATAVPRYTSNAGDDYCLVPWIDTTCTDGAQRQQRACVACLALPCRLPCGAQSFCALATHHLSRAEHCLLLRLLWCRL